MTTMRRWPIALAFALIPAVVACSPEDGRAVAADPEQTVSTGQPAPTGDDPLDPCSLITPEEVAKHSDVEADAPRWRGLSIKDARIVECRLAGPGFDTFNFGYVGYRPGRLKELLPTGGPQEKLDGVGDQAYVARERPSGSYWVAASKGSMQFLLVRASYPGEPDQRANAVAMARAAVDRLPESVVLGAKVLPPECEPADSQVITDIATEVVLARGSTEEDSLVCDYLGNGDTRVLINAKKLTESNVTDLVESARERGTGQELKAFPGAVVFYDQEGPSYSVYVDGVYSVGFRLEPRVGGPDDQAGKAILPEAGEALVRSFIDRVRALG